MTDAVRHAACRCGRLTAECIGEPVRVSVCHCLACQRRSGSAFAAQARFPADRVRTAGASRQWTSVADSGASTVHHFCPECGSTVWYRGRPHHELIAIPIGAFADPGFPSPHYSVYEERKYAWVAVTGEGIEHIA